jgi:polyhydroxyalkanoic acid synthase PhaR subunit
MSQNSTEGFDPNDPIGTWRTIRDANLDAWAKSMASFVNTDVFAKAIGMQLDTLLATTAPVQKTVHEYMETYLAQVNMPSRAEVVNLASRMTNIELRLDDMQAQLDDILAAVQAVARQAAQITAPADVELPEAAAGTNGAPKARARTRKPAE